MPGALVLGDPIELAHSMQEPSFCSMLHEAGWRVRALSTVALLGHPERTKHDAFADIMTIPGACDGPYAARLHTGSVLAGAMDFAVAVRAARALRAELDREPAHVIVSLCVAGAGAAARLKREVALTGGATPCPRTVVYFPEGCACRLWVHEETDLFLVTSRAAAAFVRRFRPSAPVAVVPPLVRGDFYQAQAQCEARQKVGIPMGAPCVLLIGSEWAPTLIAQAAAALADAGVHVLAVAGTNKRLEEELRVTASNRELIIPFGITDKVPSLMAAADLITCMAGTTTCAEARVVGRPLLLPDVIAGHGRDDLLHELKLGNAGSCEPRAADISAGALAMLDVGTRRGPDRDTLHWAPAYRDALALIGLDVAVGTSAPSACESGVGIQASRH